MSQHLHLLVLNYVGEGGGRISTERKTFRCCGCNERQIHYCISGVVSKFDFETISKNYNGCIIECMVISTLASELQRVYFLQCT